MVDTNAAARYGLTASDVQASLHSVVEGTVATSVRVGDRLYGVRVRYPGFVPPGLELALGSDP